MKKIIIRRDSIEKDSEMLRVFYAATIDGITIGLTVIHTPSKGEWINEQWAVTPSACVKGAQYYGHVDYFYVAMALRHMRNALEASLKKSTGHYHRVSIWL